MMGLGFLHPLFLLFLLGLPLLWRWLRATPPPPRDTLLPTARFLTHLPPTAMVAQHAPWWLVLLRLLLAAIIILALAGPRQMPVETTPLPKHLRLIVDNSWAATTLWPDIERTGNTLLTQAIANDAQVQILPTATLPDERGANPPFLPALEARQAFAGLRPQPWPADIARLTGFLQPDTPNPTGTIWLGHGVDEPGARALLNQLATATPAAIYYAPRPDQAPLILGADPESPIGTLSVLLRSARILPTDRAETVLALNDQGQVIARAPITLPAGRDHAQLRLDDPAFQQASTIRLWQENSAASTILRDALTTPRRVGLFTATVPREGGALLDPAYYLTRALEPYATIENLLPTAAPPQNIDIAIFTDSFPNTPDRRAAWQAWVDAGGVLLRFAETPPARRAAPAEGEIIHDDPLLPVPIGQGLRALDGVAQWQTQAPTLRPATTDSPLYPLPVPDGFAVRRQVLARPTPQLEQNTWLRLSDNTPFITGRQIGRGHVVFIHTTPDPAGSDLPLSGVYLNLLKKILTLPGRTTQADIKINATAPAEAWRARRVMDATGALTPPVEPIPTIAADQIDTQIPDPHHPPGLYAAAGLIRAVNLSERLAPMGPLDPPAGITTRAYDDLQPILDGRPPLLTLAFLLLVLDLIALLWLRHGGLTRPQPRAAATALLLFLLLLTPNMSYAATPDSTALDYNQVHFGYIPSGNAGQDDLSRRALDILVHMLKQRTAINVGDVRAIRPETDDPGPFALLYLPITGNNTDLDNPRALDNLRDYLQGGGLLFIDTLDRSTTAPEIPTNAQRTARALLSRLGLSDLRPLTSDHVLNRSFYLLPTPAPGSTQPLLYVQSSRDNAQDGVSPVVLGSENWARIASPDLPPGMLIGSTPDQERAIRLGINLTLYALTGNYKADQVHIPFILKRLHGQDQEGP